MSWKPQPDRPLDSRGRPIVSAAELEQFRREFGSDKELRDLLNADKGLVRRGTLSASRSGVPTEPQQDMRARGLRTREPVMRVTPPSPEFSPEAERVARAVMAERKRVEDFEAQLAEQRRREDLMRPGRDAIESIAPELALIAPAAQTARMAAARAAAGRTARPLVRDPESVPGGFEPVANPWRSARARLPRDEDLAKSFRDMAEVSFRKGGKVKAPSRGDGIAKRGKTKGRYL